MIEYFQRLGNRIEDQWSACYYDEERFPDLVSEQLRQEPPVEHVALTDIYDWLFESHHGIQQPVQPRLFGEPPILLYESSRFYIEALFWRTGTTHIHDHGFSGAFYVFGGSSVHSLWSFETERRFSSSFRTGRLTLDSTELLGVGDLKPIRSGDRLIHQLFHLDAPSVTLVVRTYQDSDRLPQLRYLYPGLGIGSTVADPLRQRRLLLLDGMIKGEIEGLETYLPGLLSRGDLESVYFALDMLNLSRGKVKEDFFNHCFQLARRRHDEVVELLWSACVEQMRVRRIGLTRRRVRQADARFLLALLMLMPDRDSLFRAMRLREPEGDVLEHVEHSLATVADSGGVEFNITGVQLPIFRGLVAGHDREQILAAAGRVTAPETGSQASPEQALQQMAESTLLRPLFSESPLTSPVTFPGD